MQWPFAARYLNAKDADKAAVGSMVADDRFGVKSDSGRKAQELQAWLWDTKRRCLG